MRNGECTSKSFTFQEGVHKIVLPPFPITRFLRLVGSAIYEILYTENFGRGEYWQIWQIMSYLPKSSLPIHRKCIWHMHLL